MILNIKAWQEALSRDNELPSIGKPLSRIESLYKSLGIDFDPARILGRLS